MKGMQLNSLCKAIMPFDEYVKAEKSLWAVDSSHVMILNVTNTDGNPVFGFVDEDVAIDVSLLLKMKIPADADVVLERDGENVEFAYKDVTGSIALVRGYPKVEPVFIKHKSKEIVFDVESLVKVVRIIIDTSFGTACSVLFEVKDGMLFIGNYNQITNDWKCAFYKVGKKVKDFKLLIPSDYLLKVLKAIDVKTATMKVEDDKPLKLSWHVANLRFDAMVAPRIEKD